MRRNIPDETTPTDTIDTNSNSNNSGSHYSLSSTISSTISTNNTNTNVNSNSNNNMQQIPGHHHDEDVVYVQQSAAGTSSRSTLGIMNTRANKHMNSMNASRVTIHHVDNGTNTNNDDDDDDDDYNPLLQTNFDIEPLIAKVVPAYSHSYSHSNSSSPLNLPSHSTVLNTDADATNKCSSSPQTTNPATLSATRKRKTKTVFKKPFFAFQQIGTTNSRKGKYVRTTFEQSVTSYIYDKRKRMRLLVILFGLIIIFSFVRYHNHHASFNGNNKNDNNGTGNSYNSGSSSHSHHGDENDDYNNNNDDDYSITDDNYHITIPNADKYQQQNHISTNNNIKSNNLNIDHWCRNGEKYQTSCSSCSGQPIKPQDKLYSSLWKDALELNVDLIQNYIYNSSSSSSSSQYYKNHHHSKKNNHQKQSNKNENIDSQLDVVFYGDSIIEEWNGRWMGMQNSEKLEIHKVWKSHFERIRSIDGDTAATIVNDSSGNNEDDDNDNDDDDADIGNGKKDDIENIDITLNGLALGIAGDRINNLLWRITNGNELPQELYARVFWIVIGTNDLSAGCSEEIVLVGIINIIQTLRKLRPDSIIVINGLLPRTDRTSGKLVGVNSSTMSATASISSSHDDVDTATGIDGLSSADVSTDNDKDFDDDYNYDESNMSSSKSTSGRQNSSIHDNRNDDDDDEGEGEGEDEKKSDYWPSIQAINKQLQKYARRHEKVEYFDPSHLFIAQLQTDTYQQKDKYLLEELQDDYLHPSSLGHEIWAKAILDYFVSDLDTPDYLQRR